MILIYNRIFIRKKAKILLKYIYKTCIVLYFSISLKYANKLKKYIFIAIASAL